MQTILEYLKRRDKRKYAIQDNLSSYDALIDWLDINGYVENEKLRYEPDMLKSNVKQYIIFKPNVFNEHSRVCIYISNGNKEKLYCVEYLNNDRITKPIECYPGDYDNGMFVWHSLQYDLDGLIDYLNEA